MIRITHSQRADRHELVIEGHAGERGSSTPCAAVSAIFQMAILGLMHQAAEFPDDIVFETDTSN